ncbi:hypothetical protein CFI10_11145 [Marinobacterium iners]|uniref:hypothetical protein n=1 Tax=Marinobacterium iners TaxID=48076 RepID=UPI001A8D24BD|nr:hypothetical protein [Marinobacterium iners]QSR35543.1 hypothetical protein CFI10_11145 [Marinobacterium iners]
MARRYLDNYTARITTASVSTGATTFDVDIPPPALAAGDYYEVTLTDSLDAPTKTENVCITGVSGTTLTVLRDVKGTGAQTWAADDFVDLRPTASAFEVIDGVLLKDYTETINATAGATLDRSTGGIQRLNMGANTTLNLSDLTAGQSVMYRVTGGTTYTLSYTGLGAWSDGTTPTLSTTHYLEFVHDGVEVVGFDCGGR